jgi:hypothetical protein
MRSLILTLILGSGLAGVAGLTERQARVMFRSTEPVSVRLDGKPVTVKLIRTAPKPPSACRCVPACGCQSCECR